jgi:hypothetical protein
MQTKTYISITKKSDTTYVYRKDWMISSQNIVSWRADNPKKI